MANSSLRRKILLGTAAATALAGGAVAYRHRTAADRAASDTDTTGLDTTGLDTTGAETAQAALGWGNVEVPDAQTVSRSDGARLAVWDVGKGPTVALAHCLGGSHAIWVPV